MYKWMYMFVVLVFLTINACTAITSSPQEAGDTQQLRISNIGSEGIQDLSVVLPGETPTEVVRIHFGDVSAGETTEYQAIPGGVYRFAAYEYRLNNETAYQGVVDWLGEEPLVGTQFTYQITLDTARVQGDQIQLITVLTDSN